MTFPCFAKRLHLKARLQHTAVKHACDKTKSFRDDVFPPEHTECGGSQGPGRGLHAQTGDSGLGALLLSGAVWKALPYRHSELSALKCDL